ncbi:MAG: DNA-directed RNA polymerase subunit N [Candidatus Parvarchaeum sp.]|nr:DNA-directed RNA polymerase subunit N [Candidatus Parvarchaeota archaeon]MCW1294710.1 DNA-directed RNA polymerase subunit N [Candidatus Parvarchaeum tengchongense]MCW1295789.1 DNA-directed RNA polymerase subunit N [Candidatus Parvarchaeum tengchongense]MCW1299663.1 DNA-directed RNA polymerase subunit N [Candidatus Parvarchaeum tengchongense]
MIPMRCYSCGKPLSQYWEKYKEGIAEKSPKEVLDELGIKRYCCRAVFLGTVDEDNIINFSNME